MKGLGSQLCDHLVKKVIDHLEKEINPRIKQFERLFYRSRREIGFCEVCNTPYDRYSDKIKKCAEHSFCAISCGEVWCKPPICEVCNNDICEIMCHEKACDKYACTICSKFNECHCHYCHDHHKEKALEFANYSDFRDCFIKKSICTNCSYKTAICSNCNEECKITDIADVIDIKDCDIHEHTQCGRAICKNCTDNKRIKL